MFGSAYGGATQKPPRAPDDLPVPCECTLEELYAGCMKGLSCERLVLGLDGKSTKKKVETFEVEVKPGHGQDSVLRFAGRGHEAQAYPTCKSMIEW